MAVIRDGKAVWLGGGAPAAPRAEEREHAADDDGPTTDGPSVDKKLRALRKKLRRVAELKERRRRGEELDAAQQALVRCEGELQQELGRFEAEADGDGDGPEDGVHVDTCAAVDSAEADDLNDGRALAEAEEQSGSRLQARRALKKQRHLEKLQRKKQPRARA